MDPEVVDVELEEDDEVLDDVDEDVVEVDVDDTVTAAYVDGEGTGGGTGGFGGVLEGAGPLPVQTQVHFHCPL